MTDSNVLELAKLGDPQAIAALMNQSLEAKGMLAKVERQGDCLEVVLEAERVPNRQALTAFVQKGIRNLGIPSIRAVRILGQQVGASYPAWMQELQMDAEALSETPLNIQPETDSEITIIQSLEDTLIQDREPLSDLSPLSSVTASAGLGAGSLQAELDDLWADEDSSVEQSPDFLRELLAAEVVSVNSQPDPIPVELTPDQASDASVLSFLDELSGEPATSDFPTESTQPQSAYLADLAPQLDNFTADDFDDLIAAPDPLEPLPTELWLDSPADLSADESEADLLNFLDQPPVQSDAEAEADFDLSNLDDFSDLSADFPDATFISQIPAPEPDAPPEISPQQLEDLFAAEPEVTESFSEEPWLEHLPEDLPDDLLYDAPDSQIDLQQSRVISPLSSLGDPWSEEQRDLELDLEPDLEQPSQDAGREPPDFLMELDEQVAPPVDQPIEPPIDQAFSEQPEFAAPEISDEPEISERVEPLPDLPDDLPTATESFSLRDEAEFSEAAEFPAEVSTAPEFSTALEPADGALGDELEDDADIEELPPDFLQDWEEDSPEFSEFVDASAGLPVPVAPVPVAPVTNALPTEQPDLTLDAAPSALEEELDLLDLDAPELESPGLEALDLSYPDLPQLNLSDGDEFELAQPLPDADLAELLSETPEGIAVGSEPPPDFAASPAADVSLSQDSLEQGLGDFRAGFVEPLPDEFFENEAESPDWQSDLHQPDLDQPLDLDIDDIDNQADYIIDQTPPNLPSALGVTAGPPLQQRSDRPVPAAIPTAAPAPREQPALIWILLPLCAFIGGLLGFVLFKDRISTPPPPPATEPAVPVPTPGSAAPAAPPSASPSSANPSDPNALQVALERADGAVDLGQTAQSVDDWKLVANRWQQSIELLKAIPASSPSYGSAQQKLTEYQSYLVVAQRKADQPIVATAPLGVANIKASPSPAASPAASPASSLTCNPIASTPNSQPVELSSVQFSAAAAQPSPIIGCITNHTDQPIAAVDVVYGAAAETTGKLTFAQLDPQQTVPFKSEFTVVPETKELAIAALSWMATGSQEAKRLPVTISVTRPNQQG